MTTKNKWHLIDDIEYLLRENKVDPEVIKRACEIHDELKTKRAKREEALEHFAGLSFLFGLLTLIVSWQISILFFILAAYSFRHS